MNDETAYPADEATTLAELKRWVRDFSRERDWEQFHHPKELAIALACEVGEVLEHFRYKDLARIDAELTQPELKQALAYELADCLWLVLRMADVCGVDLSAALKEKLAEAARKYPAELVRGKSDKYTAYRQATEAKDPSRSDVDE